MATTTPPPGSSAGARWTAGLGAFLLVAAAATFVTVRWEQIPDGAKFGALVAVTGACLLAGLRLRAGLPITASALFHLGVLLVPIDVAALGVRAGWEWPRMLLAQPNADSPLMARSGERRILPTKPMTARLITAAMRKPAPLASCREMPKRSNCSPSATAN